MKPGLCSSRWQLKYGHIRSGWFKSPHPGGDEPGEQRPALTGPTVNRDIDASDMAAEELQGARPGRTTYGSIIVPGHSPGIIATIRGNAGHTSKASLHAIQQTLPSFFVRRAMIHKKHTLLKNANRKTNGQKTTHTLSRNKYRIHIFREQKNRKDLVDLLRSLCGNTFWGIQKN